MAIGMLFYIGDPTETVFCDHFVWRDLIFAFELDYYIILDYTANHDYRNYSDHYKESHVVKSIKEAKILKPKHKTVWIKQHGQDIKTFKHPKNNVLYIIGKDSVAPLSIKADKEVGIYYPNEDKELWAIQAASIILYDRSIKI